MLCFTLVTKASDKCNQNGAMLYYLKGFDVQVTTKRFEVLFSCMQERSSSPRDSLFKISSSDCHSCFSSFKVLKHDTIKIWDFQVIKEKKLLVLKLFNFLPKTYHTTQYLSYQELFAHFPYFEKLMVWPYHMIYTVREEYLERGITTKTSRQRLIMKLTRNWHWSISCHWSLSASPESIRKPLIFWCFLGLKK